MDFSDLSHMCQRAFAYTLGKKKLALTSLAIFLCGLLVIFCMSLAMTAGPWMGLSLRFLPIFLASMALMGFGIVLIRSYHDEVKQKEVSFWSLFLRSWDATFSAASLFILLLLAYLGLWISLGVFLLAKELPFVGEFFACLFAFIPFVLNLVSLLLCLFSVYVIFVMGPSIGLKSKVPQDLLQLVVTELSSSLFLRFSLFIIALLPLAVSLLFLVQAWAMTAQLCEVSSHLQIVLQWFFIMIPSSLLLAPSVIFFFNMAAETHSLIYKSKSYQ